MYYLAKLLKALHSDASPWQLAFGIAFGMLIGLTPLMRLHNLVFLFVVLLFRVNLATFLLSFALFSFLGLILDPLFANWGASLLSAAGMQESWTALYNTTLGQLSQFYHSATLGSLLGGLIAFVPVLLLSKWLVVHYRESFMAWVEKTYLIQMLKGSRVYQLYQSMGG